MNFEPEVTVASKLPEFEGVSFTFHKLTEGRRLQVRAALAETNAKVRDMLVEKVAAAEADSETKTGLQMRIGYDIQEIIEDKVCPAWVRALLISVTGLTIRGQAVTVANMIDSGPKNLYDEISAVIRAEAGLTEKERGESVPPTTSSAQADGRMSNTSAGAVESAEIILPAIAEGPSPDTNNS